MMNRSAKAVRVGDIVGTGCWIRGEVEFLLIATRGNVPAPAPGEQMSRYPDGAIGEVFLQSVKGSSSVDAVVRDCGVLVSLCAQHGCELAVIERALLHDLNGE